MPVMTLPRLASVVFRIGEDEATSTDSDSDPSSRLTSSLVAASTGSGNLSRTAVRKPCISTLSE